MCGLSSTRERGEGERLVTVALLNAEEPDALNGEQFVHHSLHVSTHVAGKLSRSRDQPIERNAGEMPFNGRAGKVEPLCFGDGAEIPGGCQHTVVADQRRLADHTERVLGKIAAQLATVVAHVIAGLGRHHQLMARCPNSFLCSLQERFGDGARIGAANRFASLLDCEHHLGGIGQRLTEYRAEQADHKILRRVLVIMKNELNVTSLNAVHRKTPENELKAFCLTHWNKARTIFQ